MANRNLFHRLIDLSNEQELATILSQLGSNGKQPRFLVGSVWCVYNAERHELVEEGTNIQVAAGMDMGRVSKVEWGFPNLAPSRDNMAPQLAGNANQGATDTRQENRQTATAPANFGS